MRTPTTNEQHTRVLHAAYQAWMNAAGLRQARLRNKRFTYGDQWGDLVKDYNGCVMTEGEHLANQGCASITNNLIRQMVKTIVGRFRSQYIKQDDDKASALAQASRDNELDELDSRALEEFLISGCCIQRVDTCHEPGDTEHVRVDNVNVNRLFVGTMNDTRAWDCELIGQLHDLNIAQLLRRVAGGNQRKAAWVRRLYTDNAESRLADFTTRLGADTQLGTDFWHASDGKCRAIEVWTLESREVVVCHNRHEGTLTVEPCSAMHRLKSRPDITTRWDIATVWHCRWFSPMGDLLAEYDSPWPHGSHPFVIKLYPLTDGEVHAVVEDIIDTQKHVNRMISLLDQVMRTSAKGVLLFPETALPEGWTWEDARRCWSSANGLLPYNPRFSDAKPEQINANANNSSAYQMIELQMKLFEEISGVSGALQGKNPTVVSANVYQLQSENANIALSDVYDTFQAFRRQRDRKMLAISNTNL
ncbi:MAG: hypothetical protein IJG42_09250 [Muribaculaceae bacterium]|nr:hypothetical protein [Muribaculaceae bacterium]